MATICHINTTFIHKSGSGRRTLSIVRALADSGHAVIQIVGRDFEPHPQWDQSEVKVIKVPELVKYINPVKDLKSLLILYKALKSTKPQIVHTHLAKAGILGRIAAAVAGVPIIVQTVHGPTFSEALHPFKRFLFRTLERLCGLFTDYFVFVGEELRQEYISNKICRDSNSVVIHSGRPREDYVYANGLSQAELHAVRGSLTNDPVACFVGYVARLVPSKNQLLAIRMLSEVHKRGVKAHLVLIGEAHLAEEKNYESEVRSLAVEIGMDPFVHFAGYQSDILRYTKAMDLLILPSRYEGLPNVAVEAGIASRPFISFDVSGVREVVTDGVTGYIVKQGDLTGMVDKICYLALHRDEAIAMGERARKKVEGLYDTEVMVREKLDFYGSILKRVKNAP